MGDLNVIDRFMADFIRYIDSGFGLLGGDVAFLTSVLVGIDITLAGLFWALGGEGDVIGRFLKKILYVGAFALIISSFSSLADIIFRSFAGLGITAGGGSLSPGDLLRPGFIASTGFDAAQPLLEQVSEMLGPIAFFENFLTIAVLMIAWLFVIVAFFVLSIQLFITIIEFKLTTLAGFVLIPFGLFGKTAFLAERVLGNVVSSGVKVLVLAVVIGIGSTLFAEFTRGFGGNQPSVEDAMAIVLAALSLLGLGIFGPGIANGLISGGPQLGAGAAIGTGLAAGGAVVAGGAAAGLAVRGAGAAVGATAAAARGGAALAGGAATSYSLASAGQSGAAGVASGLGGVARAGASAATQPITHAAGRTAGAMSESYRSGAKSAVEATGGTSTMGTIGGGAASEDAPAPGSPPAWAQRMKRHQTMSHGATAAAHAVKSGDSHGGGASVSLQQDNR